MLLCYGPRVAVNLRDLARAAGLDPEYTSWRGQQVSSSDETLRQALASLAPDLGVDLDRDDALDALERMKWLEVVPPVLLAWDGQLALTFNVPAEMEGDWECEVTLDIEANASGSAVVGVEGAGGGGVIRAHG